MTEAPRWEDLQEAFERYARGRQELLVAIGVDGSNRDPLSEFSELLVAALVPNYMGFRYDGKLQSIHHVDNYDVVESPYGLLPGAPDLRWDEPAYFLRLGPPFQPNHEVRTGPGIFRAAPLTADLDLLLTCSTISEARDATKARRVGSAR